MCDPELETLLDFDALSRAEAVGLTLGALIASGLGVPIPEDLTLVTAGYAIYRGVWSAAWAIPTGVVGVLCGDSAMYFLGRAVGLRFLATRWGKRLLSPRRVDRARSALHRRPIRVLILSRFVPLLRAPVYFSAGSLALPYRRFLLGDFLGVCMSVPLVILVASELGEHIDSLLQVLSRGRWVVGGGVVIVLRSSGIRSPEQR